MKIKEAIIVEGRYDKITLDAVCDAHIVPTYGFSIFTDTEQLAYIRSLAEKTGIIILMDSDAAGFKIRNFLKAQIKTGLVLDAYIPTLPGKEKRKSRPGAEGTLGVEGMDAEILREVLLSVATPDDDTAPPVTEGDFYKDGLSGGKDAARRRALLASHLSLPPRISRKALLSAVNVLMSRTDYETFIKTIV